MTSIIFVRRSKRQVEVKSNLIEVKTEKSRKSKYETNTEDQKAQCETGIESQNWLSINLLGCFYNKDRAKRYKRLLRRSEARLLKDLDIQYLMQSRSLMTILYSILLKDKQKTAVNSLNKLSLKDSSNSSEDETFSMI